ncbi:hypothetical protein R3Q06_33640 [Rhodococcus erythropolis]|uniref:hypothetical protein n=1 Tax=Rhodococcus erythropolis TaxID=1833 RepID=UPI002949E8DB|nr:hypothetical protein [Rhodococcus erythropolis]MDV6278375.1 hypothetical protein [Rhodococcus erythropolis]
MSAALHSVSGIANRTPETDVDVVEKKLRAMLAALDDSLAGISDAREALRGLYSGPAASDAVETVLAGEAATEDIATHIATHLADAARRLRAALAVLRSQQQLTTAATLTSPIPATAPRRLEQ